MASFDLFDKVAYLLGLRVKIIIKLPNLMKYFLDLSGQIFLSPLQTHNLPMRSLITHSITQRSGMLIKFLESDGAKFDSSLRCQVDTFRAYIDIFLGNVYNIRVENYLRTAGKQPRKNLQ